MDVVKQLKANMTNFIPAHSDTSPTGACFYALKSFVENRPLVYTLMNSPYPRCP